MKRIEIIWRDSRRYLYQMSAEDTFEVCIITSIGHLVEKNNERIVIAQDNIEGDWRGVSVIPRANVIRMRLF